MNDKFDQDRYMKLRDKMIENNENVVDNIYLDTRAVPTISAGVALIERGKDKRWHVNADRVAKLANMLNLTKEENKILNTSLNKQESLLNKYQPKPTEYSNFKSLLSSELGKEAAQIFGTIKLTKHNGTYTYDVYTQSESTIKISLTRQQSMEMYAQIAPEYERRLDNAVLKKVNCPKEALSEEQRAALYSMTYHGRIEKAKKVADAIGDYWRGEISETALHSRIKQTIGANSNFSGREKSELQYLELIKQRPEKHSMEKSDTNLAELNLSPAGKLQALIQGFKHDQDGTFTAKALADNADVVANFRDELRETLKQNQAQEVAQNTPQVQEERSYGGRSFS